MDGIIIYDRPRHDNRREIMNTIRLKLYIIFVVKNTPNEKLLVLSLNVN